MTSEIFGQSAFGVYEVLSNIVPGSVIVATGFIFYLSVSHLSTQEIALPDIFLSLLLVFLSFIVGVAIQGLSAHFERWIFLRTHREQPSKTLLDSGNEVFPAHFKSQLLELAQKRLRAPKDSDPQHVFDLCYSYVIQKGIGSRVALFLSMYSFSRNMTVAMLLEPILLISWALFVPTYSSWLAVLVLGSLALAYLFYERFLRYSNSFAKEVYRSFYVDEVTRSQ